MIKESLKMDAIRGYRSLSGQPAIGSPGTVLSVTPYPRRAV